MRWSLLYLLRQSLLCFVELELARFCLDGPCYVLLSRSLLGFVEGEAEAGCENVIIIFASNSRGNHLKGEHVDVLPSGTAGDNHLRILNRITLP